MKLGRILEYLKIGDDVGHKWLHVAGNDGNYTLRAVLPECVACQFERQTGEGNSEGQRRIERIKHINLGYIPRYSEKWG